MDGDRHAIRPYGAEAPGKHDTSVSRGAGLLIVGAGKTGDPRCADVGGDAFSSQYSYSTITPTVAPR